jgi:hypothetical protein
LKHFLRLTDGQSFYDEGNFKAKGLPGNPKDVGHFQLSMNDLYAITGNAPDPGPGLKLPDYFPAVT